jgi:probable HAF family extracellular repeat protein
MRAGKAVVVGAVLALISEWACAQAIYRLTDLGALGGTDSFGSAINASGQVTGYAETTGDAAYHAFLWDGSTMRDLGTLGGLNSSGVAINDSGQVTGTANTEGGDAGFKQHAFLWNGTTMRDLGTLPAHSVYDVPGPSYGTALNASGQVTGSAYTTDDPSDKYAIYHPFLWNGTEMQDLGTLGSEGFGTGGAGNAINDSGQITGYVATPVAGTFPGDVVIHAFVSDGATMQDLGTLGGQNSVGYAINASGQVAGIADTTGNAASHAFLWDGSRMQDLGTLGGQHDSFAVDINDSGQVTGYANLPQAGLYHAFLWDGTRMKDLGTLAGTNICCINSRGIAINASGQVTGTSATSGDAGDHAFLWDGTALRDLNNLIDVADPLQRYVTLWEGIDINDRGQIVANGTDSRTGHTHAYLVSPVTADTTPPVITPVVTGTLGGQSWYRSTVTVTWEVTDAQSPISATAGCRRTVLFSDTPGTTITCVARSNGGKNRKSVTIKRDVTSPAVVIGAPVDGRTYHTHQQVAAVYACADQTSGIKQCAGPVSTGASIDTASAGTKSFAVKVLDMAGNVGSKTVHYQVVN